LFDFLNAILIFNHRSYLKAGIQNNSIIYYRNCNEDMLMSKLRELVSSITHSNFVEKSSKFHEISEGSPLHFQQQQQPGNSSNPFPTYHYSSQQEHQQEVVSQGNVYESNCSMERPPLTPSPVFILILDFIFIFVCLLCRDLIQPQEATIPLCLT